MDYILSISTHYEIGFRSRSNKIFILINQNRYKPFIISRAKNYFIVGADREDIIQEGLIGLYKAIRDYNPDKKTSFSSFAKLVILRHIAKTNRQKHILNSFISLDKPLDNNNKRIELISNTDIEKDLIDKEVIEKAKEKLSVLELNILNEYLNDISYKEISQKLNISPKSIDNAIKRIKNKIKDLVEL